MQNKKDNFNYCFAFFSQHFSQIEQNKNHFNHFQSDFCLISWNLSKWKQQQTDKKTKHANRHNLYTNLVRGFCHRIDTEIILLHFLNGRLRMVSVTSVEIVAIRWNSLFIWLLFNCFLFAVEGPLTLNAGWHKRSNNFVI